MSSNISGMILFYNIKMVVETILKSPCCSAYVLYGANCTSDSIYDVACVTINKRMDLMDLPVDVDTTVSPSLINPL